MLIHIQRGKGGRDRYVPLSPTLLATLRVYYRWMRPKTWLFPGTVHGWRADKPITPKVAVGRLCRRRPARRPSQALQSAPAAPFLRDAPARKRAPTSGRFSCSSATWRSGTRCSISISRRSICRPWPVRSMRSRSRARDGAPDAPEAQAVTRPPFEVADIVRQHGDRFLETHRAWVTGQHRRVLRAIAQCRTAALGGHRDRCDQCAQPALSYNSCRDRHCPKCLTAGPRTRGWRRASRSSCRSATSTSSSPCRSRSPGSRSPTSASCTTSCFAPTAATLLQVAANPKRLGAADRRAHGPPHLGATPPASSARPLRRARRAAWRRTGRGGSTRARPSSSRSRSCGTVFRGQAGRRAARGASRTGDSTFPGALAARSRPTPRFRAWLRSLYRQPWVVYAKPPFGSPAHVLHYLARYTHRVAISNHRLVAVTDETVAFRWKDYRHGSQVRTLTLDVDEFLRRFLLHVLPKGFVRIRYFGSARRAVPHPRSGHVSSRRSRRRRPATPNRSGPGHATRRRGRARAAARPCASSND